MLIYLSDIWILICHCEIYIEILHQLTAKLGVQKAGLFVALMPSRRRKSNGSLSVVPKTTYLRAFAWTKLIISFALPLTVGIFTLVTTIQNRLIAQQHRDQDSQQANEQREEGSKRAMDEQQEHV